MTSPTCGPLVDQPAAFATDPRQKSGKSKAFRGPVMKAAVVRDSWRTLSLASKLRQRHQRRPAAPTEGTTVEAEVASAPPSGIGTGAGRAARAAVAAGSCLCGGRLGAAEGWSRGGAGARGGGEGAAACGVAVSDSAQLKPLQRARRCGGPVGERLSVSKAGAAPALRPGLGLRRETAP